MPQDGPRSVGYRSFFSCDDPKGVAEYKTNRKSKNESHKLEEEEPLKKQNQKQKNLSRSFSLNGDDRNEQQLMQISRGAQKLNQVIDTWSKENSTSFDRQSKDIAQDLLKGALDLKESLAMLGKIQEANSQVMAKLKKKKHKEKEKGTGGGIERTTSDRFGYANHRTATLEFDQNPRYSVDGGSATTRDCFEELRDVIQESFARQNLLPKRSHINEEKAKSEFLLVPSSPDMLLLPNSCSKVEENGYSDSKKSQLSWDPPKNSKEEKAKSEFSQDLPSTSSSQSSHIFSYEFESSDSSISKSLETKQPKAAPNVIAKLMGLEEISPKVKNRALNQGRVTVDIDLPKARRPPFAVQKAVDPQPKTLEALTETIQFKGLIMSSKSPRRPDHEHLPYVSDWRKGFGSDSPPIVIIKPLRVSDLMEETFRRRRPKHEDLDREKMLRKSKMKDGHPPRPNNDIIHTKVRAEKPQRKNSTQKRGDKENPSATKIKASTPVKPRIEKKEVTERNVPRIQKAVPHNTRKPIDAETEKSRDACKVKSASPRKPEREPNFPKVRVSQEKCADSAAEYLAMTASHSSSVPKKNVKKEKQVSEPSTLLAGSKIKGDNAPFEHMPGSVQDVNAKLIMPPQQLSGDKEKDISGDSGNCGKSTSYIVGDSPKPLLPDSGVKTNEDAKSGITYDVPEKKTFKRSNTMRNLLSGSTSFLNRAEELFEIYSYQTAYSHTNTTSCSDYGTVDNKLLLDCAKELLENRSLQCGVAVQPMPNMSVKGLKLRVSLDQLVNEICDGIEYLKSYCKLAEKGLVVHKLHTLLQKDAWGKGAANGSWDSGWSKGFSGDEIDQVVVNIEQQILSGLIEDVIRDMAD